MEIQAKAPSSTWALLVPMSHPRVYPGIPTWVGEVASEVVDGDPCEGALLLPRQDTAVERRIAERVATLVQQDLVYAVHNGVSLGLQQQPHS